MQEEVLEEDLPVGQLFVLLEQLVEVVVEEEEQVVLVAVVVGVVVEKVVEVVVDLMALEILVVVAAEELWLQEEQPFVEEEVDPFLFADPSVEKIKVLK